MFKSLSNGGFVRWENHRNITVDFPVNHGADYRRICVMSFTANFAARESQWAQHHGKKSNALPTLGVHWHLIWNIPTLRLRLNHRMGRWHVDRCSKVPKKDPKGMAHHQRPDNRENVREMKCWTVRTRNDLKPRSQSSIPQFPGVPGVRRRDIIFSCTLLVCTYTF